MKFTLSWLKQHLDTQASLDEISVALTACGLEVEEIADRAAALAPFRVAKIVEARQHPNADRLRVCDVDIGGERLQVVCGAPNARTGLVTAFAPVGTTIPRNGLVLKTGNIRGEASNGMLCSSFELELSEDHEGIMELPEDAPIGAPLVQVLGVSDPVIEIAITPNRADCLGVRGVARDLAAAGIGTLKPWAPEPVAGKFASPIGVSLDAKDACPLFVGRYIRGVKNGPSPDWLKQRLEAIGLRPISILVDITNLFAFDLGRPLHVFDAKKLVGKVGARLSKAGETLSALNGKDYVLEDGMTVIVDDSVPGGRVLGLGGVVGGVETSCTDDTTDVFLESALFDPMRIAATGRKLGIITDARYRFERGVDPESAVAGAEAATKLILELCGGEPSELVIGGAVPAWQRTLNLRPGRVLSLGGVDVPAAESKRILTALGFTVTDGADGRLVVQPPSWRADIEGEADLVEEILRINGFDKIPTDPMPRPAYMPKAVLTGAQRREAMLRRLLAGRGLMEAVTWAFLKKADAERFGGGDPALTLANPIASDLDQMRPTALPNLLAAASRNRDRGIADVPLFEIGGAYLKGSTDGQKTLAVGVRVGAASPRHWQVKSRQVEWIDAKADLFAALEALGLPARGLTVTRDAPAWYHPGRSGAVKLGGKQVLGWFGEVHPSIREAYGLDGAAVAFELDLAAVPLPKSKGGRSRPLLKVSAFQPLVRDFAFIVDKAIAADQLVRAARGAEKDLVVDVAVFDRYAGTGLPEDKVSLALSVTLQPVEKTLTDAEIEAVSKKIVDAVAAATGASLRG